MTDSSSDLPRFRLAIAEIKSCVERSQRQIRESRAILETIRTILGGDAGRPEQPANRRVLDAPSPAPPQTVRAAQPTTEKPFSGRKILVIEDEFALAGELSTLFTRMGASDVRMVGSRVAAIVAITHDRWDGATLDIRLRDHDAFDVAAGLIEADVPVVIYSGYDCDRLPPYLRRVPTIAKPTAPMAVALALGHECRRPRLEPEC